MAAGLGECRKNTVAAAKNRSASRNSENPGLNFPLFILRPQQVV
jgi:hypothetical protein